MIKRSTCSAVISLVPQPSLFRALAVPGLAAFLAISTAVGLTTASRASDPSTENKQWQDQETWTQFTEKERHGGFRMTTPKATPKRTPVLESAINALPQQASGFPPTILGNQAQAPATNFTVPAYICMPGQAPAVQQPIQHVETTMTPVIRQTPYVGLGGWGGGYGGWGGNYGGWGGGYGGWGGHHGWGTNLWGGGGPFIGGGGPSIVGFRRETRTVQTGPSRSSGNYYMPSTPDPSASGNYYASPTPAPVAMPVINKEPDARDYWGKTGNPLPGDMQPQ